MASNGLLITSKVKVSDRKLLDAFVRKVRVKGKEFFRDMPWRNTDDPYKILVSEVMLQQTQVDRVIPKYLEFTKKFPTVKSLAAARFDDVLRVWSGLGYNRRALFLHKSVGSIAKELRGEIPASVEELIRLPGIGYNTAAAVLVYAFNMPLSFIETNIRTVYIHELYASKNDEIQVSDSELLPLVEKTLDKNEPRRWYWALMDYGSHLKKVFKNPSRLSTHHTKQSRFEGSRRQLRGKLLRLLADAPLTFNHISERLDPSSDILIPVLDSLMKDELIVQDGKGRYKISSKTGL